MDSRGFDFEAPKQVRVALELKSSVLDSFVRFEEEARKSVGRPEYPRSLVFLLGVMKFYLELSFRQTEEVGRRVLGGLGVAVPSYATLSRKVREVPGLSQDGQSQSAGGVMIDIERFEVKALSNDASIWTGSAGYVAFELTLEPRRKKLVDIEVCGTEGYGGKEDTKTQQDGPDARLFWQANFG
jgi:hypothetical protein